MQDQPPNTLGQIKPGEAAAVSQVGEDPAQPASLCPLDLSSRSRDDVLMSTSGDGRRGRRAWVVQAAVVPGFRLGRAGTAHCYHFSHLDAPSNAVTQTVQC